MIQVRKETSKKLKNENKKISRTQVDLSFYLSIQTHISLRFLALCLCLQHLDDNLLLLNQESTLDPER